MINKAFCFNLWAKKGCLYKKGLHLKSSTASSPKAKKMVRNRTSCKLPPPEILNIMITTCWISLKKIQSADVQTEREN